MKILFISPSFISKNLRGGTEKYLFNLINKLKKTNQISILIPNDYAVALEKVAVYTYFKFDFPIIGELVKGISILLSFLRIVLFHRPDIISSFLPHSGTGFLFPISRIFAIKTIHNFRGYIKGGKIVEFFLNISYFFTDSIISNAISLFNHYRESIFLGKKKFDSLKKFYLPNAIDANFWFIEKRGEHYIFDLAFVGNIYDNGRLKAKGFPTLYNAVQILAKKYNMRLKVLIIGAYSINKIKKLIKDFDQTLFDFEGLIRERRKIRDLLLKSRIFVLSSMIEGMPNALMEAMCLGIPSIATDVGAVRELIKDGWNGIVVPPSDSELLAEKIRSLLQDNSLQQQFMQNGRSWLVGNFSWKRNLDLTTRLYNNLLKKETSLANQN